MARACRFVSWGVLAALVLPLAAMPQVIRLGPELQVNTFTESSQRLPKVAASSAGDFVVVWRSEQDGGDYGIFARRFSSAGVALATEFQVNSYTFNDQLTPAVAVDAGGGFLVAWTSEEQDGSNYGIFARRFSSLGVGLAIELQVNSHTASRQLDASVGMDADGDFVVAWRSRRTGAYDVFGRRGSSAGSLVATEFQVNTYTLGLQSSPSVGTDADGDFVVVWESFQQDLSGRGIFARRFTSSGAGFDEFHVTSHTTGHQSDPALGVAADGAFVIAWRKYSPDGSGDSVFARRFSSSGLALGDDFQVNIHTLGFQAGPSVAADAGGNFVVVWASSGQDGSSYGVFARRFSSAGAFLASEFQVNTLTENAQGQASVAAFANGAFVVAWDSGVFPDYDVFAQRFGNQIAYDVDGNGVVAPLTDGLLALRYMFGFRGATLITDAVDLDGCNRCDAPAIEAYLAGQMQ